MSARETHRKSPWMLAAFAALSCTPGPKPEGATPGMSEVPLASASAPPSLGASAAGVPASPSSAEVPLMPLDAGGAGGGSGAGGGGEFGAVVGPCPAGMAQVGRFCIDKYEAHLATLDGKGKLLAHPHNLRPEPKVAYVAVSEPGVFPQGYMSRVEAEAACKQASKRLCSMSEFRSACAGKKSLIYPYGNRREPNRCASSKKHLLSELYGKNGKAWKYDEHFNNPELLVQEGFLDKTGSHEGCQSEAGVFDLVGNLHEWVKDTVTEELVERMEEESVERRKQPWHVGNGIFMGGFFSTTSEHGPGCTFTTIAHEPSYHDYSIGFRCCADAAGAGKGEKGREKGRGEKGNAEKKAL